jgi:hemoglobin
MEETIYESIGGLPALVTVVDDFYVRVLADPELAGYFAETDMVRLKDLQTRFFAVVLGGPHAYNGADMATAHRGRGITQANFDSVAGHLVAALAAAGVPEPTISAIVEKIAPLAPDIVESAAA